MTEVAQAVADREIVRGAREIIAESGVEGLTMRRLSARLGVALGATYHYVPTKHDLLVLVGRDLYDEVVFPPPDERGWAGQLKQLMVNVAEVIGRYPGMGGYLLAHLDEIPPTALSREVMGILDRAGFRERGVVSVLSALFFYMTGMTAGGLSAQSGRVFETVNLQALFEDGLDLLLEAAQARLDEDRKPARRRRSR